MELRAHNHRILGALAALLLALLLCGASPARAHAASTVDHTANEAMVWLESIVGDSIDFDGYYGAQCVDLVMTYYSYLGVEYSKGNGCDYATNTLPAGWTRTKGGVPHAGDILVYGATDYNPYGHVAIMGQDGVSYHQNLNNNGTITKSTSAYNSNTYDIYWGCITPNWPVSDAAKPGWRKVNGSWYLYASNGLDRLTGWQQVGGKWYFLDPITCQMDTGWIIPGATWYYLSPSGAMVTGWYKVGEKWYYFDAKGHMYEQKWVKTGGKWYYLKGGGSMAKSEWLHSGGSWYYLKANGSMAAGEWLCQGTKWYYLTADGTMATSKTLVDGYYYTFYKSGAWTGDLTAAIDTPDVNPVYQ